MIDQPEVDPTRRRPGPPSDAIMGLADALARRLAAGSSNETRTEGVTADVLSDSTPVRLGRFEIEGRLGAGAMGVVYAARDPMLRRDVAIKVLAPARTSPESMVRARREAQAMAQLSHPNVVKVFAIGEHEGALFIAMERIRGETLRSWQSARHTSDEVLAVYRQAAHGLAELHAHGLVHRDFKPSNAMIGEDGRVRVLDLGLVTQVVRDASSQELSHGSGGSLTSGSATRSDAVLGTPAYMSPEQFLGEPVTAASDQFSFCVALYEALYGYRPFKAKTMTQLIEAICESRIESPKPDALVPRRIYRVLRRGLSREPRKRHASMDALVEALSGRSRAATWVGGAGLLALAAIGGAGGGFDREEECPAAEQFERVWSPERRAQLRDVLGEESAAVGLVSSNAQRLAEVLSQGCGAHTSPLVLACHHELIQRFDGALGLLIEAPEGLQTLGVAEGMIDPLYCDGAESRPGSDAEMAELSGLLQRIDGLALSGLFDEALQEAHVAVRRAQALGRPLVSSEAFYQRGKVYARRGELEPANSDFTAAYELNVMTGSYGGAATVALSQVWVTQHQNDLDGAEHWLRVAASAGEAEGGLNQGRRARILMRGGEVALARRDMGKARTLLTQSVEAWRELDNPREEATVLASLVSVEIEAGEFDAALASAKLAIDVFTAAHGDGDPQLGTHYHNLGNVYQRRGQPEEALAAFDQAVSRRARSYGEEHPATGEARYAKGTALMDLGRTQEAKLLFERVHKDAPSEHPLVAATDTQLAQLASIEGDHERALALANRAFVFYESQFGADHAESATVRAELAKVKLSAGDLAGALADARAARRVFEERFGKTHDAAGQCLALEAEALAKQGSLALARPLYERALSIAVAAQGESSVRAVELRAALAALGRTG